jgi:hypothetical protein
VLVRPDGFVGWRSGPLPGEPSAALHDALRAILGRHLGGPGSGGEPDRRPDHHLP